MDNKVYFNQSNLIKIDEKVINDLKKKAMENKDGKFRLCLQHSSQDSLHEMFIVRPKGDYGRPDKHLYTTESHTIVDGAMLVIIFGEDGQIREVFELSKEHYHTYRIDTNTYHMQIPLTEQVVYYEVKLGPFTDKSNIFPEWAPDLQDTEKVTAYMKELDIKLRNFRGNLAEKELVK
jgi:cupin fold WbuC family metalloprotein